MTFDFCCTQTALLVDSEQAHQFSRVSVWLGGSWHEGGEEPFSDPPVLRPTYPQPTIMEHRSLLSWANPWLVPPLFRVNEALREELVYLSRASTNTQSAGF